VLYEKMVSWLEMDVMKPDVVVYLQAGTETLLDRISRRGRPYERDIERAYLAALNEAYNHFFFHYVEAPLLVVNTDSIDFVNRPEDFEDLRRRILTHRDGTVYYQPIERQEAP
jgi:deoxyguanosine kinase